MRDMLVLVIMVAAIPVSLIRPFYGVLIWTFFSFLVPHRLAWGEATRYNVVLAAAIPTLVGLFLGFGRERGRLQISTEIRILLVLWVLFGVSSWFSIYPDRAWPKWWEVTKVMALLLTTLWVVRTREHLRLLFLVIALSLGFYGFKGGAFSILTGGHHRVFGPPRSFLTDNNALGLSLVMILPILNALAQEETVPWRRHLLRAVFFLSIVGAIFTYSRGAALGLAVVFFLMWYLSKRRFLLLGPLLIVAAIGSLFVPQAWFDRMHTIKTYEQDASAMTRINEWIFCWNVAVARPLTGGGFRLYSQETYNRYHPTFGLWWDAHSIYYSVLAEHGFIAFGLWMLLWVVLYRGLWRLRSRFRGSTEKPFVRPYATMLLAGFGGYLVSGAFLDMAYHEPMYQLVGTVAILKNLAHAPPHEPAPAMPRSEAGPQPDLA